MVTLYKPELNVTIDLEGVSGFHVHVPYRSKTFWVLALFFYREEVVMWEEDWDRAHLYRKQLTKHVIDEGVNVVLDEITGSIRPA